MMHLRTSLVALAFLVAIATNAAAESDFVPLSEYLKRPVSDIVETYPMTRCAGLYFGVLDYSGRSFLPDVQADTKRNAVLLVRAIVAIRSSKSEGEISELAQYTMQIVDKIAKAYVDRFKGNYAMSGQAWSEDAVVESDITTCRSVTLYVAEEYADLLPSR